MRREFQHEFPAAHLDIAYIRANAQSVANGDRKPRLVVRNTAYGNYMFETPEQWERASEDRKSRCEVVETVQPRGAGGQS